MANVNEIIRTDRETFNSIVDGTHSTETYNDNNVYQVELDEPIELGASGSGLKVVNDTLYTIIPVCTQTTAGNYKLRATVDSNGAVTYSWVAE